MIGDDRKRLGVAPATYGRARTMRLGLHDYAADWPVHLTICAHTGRPFTAADTAVMVCHALERCAELTEFALYVYCLMPDHLHVVVSPAGSERPVSDYLQRFKSFTTSEHRRRTGQQRLWQRTARYRVLRPNEELAVLAAYIANNPVRAELVQCWLDWPYTRVFCYEEGRQARRPDATEDAGRQARRPDATEDAGRQARTPDGTQESAR
jgi:REP element-mobilizing transposase RayT